MKKMNKLTQKPRSTIDPDVEGRFQKFRLTENPFPSEPHVNKQSNDPRINGEIYESKIRTRELEKVKQHFISPPQNNLAHLRLGYIVDSSYIGRGNGKSAFLINLQSQINENFCLDISQGHNKCFSVIVSPEAGGRTKTFTAFIDAMFHSMVKARIINVALAILRIEAILKIDPSIFENCPEKTVEEWIHDLGRIEWYLKNDLSYSDVCSQVKGNEWLGGLPPEFPLIEEIGLFDSKPVSQEALVEYYKNGVRRPQEKIEFFFSHLVAFFQAAGFNGAYMLVDDFERIPDFQSTRQKKDFALELRSALFDGGSRNARYGFYNFLLVLHAGVPRLIGDAWDESGLENRAPISLQKEAKHVVSFEKLSAKHAKLLIEKYLESFQILDGAQGTPEPFTERAIERIGELSEFNAAKILKICYDLLDKAADLREVVVIDEGFVDEHVSSTPIDDGPKALTIGQTETVNLHNKASEDIDN